MWRLLGAHVVDHPASHTRKSMIMGIYRVVQILGSKDIMYGTRTSVTGVKFSLCWAAAEDLVHLASLPHSHK